MIQPDDVRIRLIAITDDLRDQVDGLVTRARAAEQGGATMVLLRLKHVDARTLVEVGRALVAALSIPVVVSERLDVALACGASGVHLNAESMPVIALRPHVAAGFLIGGSISADADLASAAEADYVTVGPVFGTATACIGIDGLRRFVAACGRPAVAIGGIDVASAGEAMATGARGIAAIHAVLGASDPATAALELRTVLGDHVRD